VTPHNDGLVVAGVRDGDLEHAEDLFDSLATVPSVVQVAAASLD
jgi:hypothetical protein